MWTKFRGEKDLHESALKEVLTCNPGIHYCCQKYKDKKLKMALTKSGLEDALVKYRRMLCGPNSKERKTYMSLRLKSF